MSVQTDLITLTFRSLGDLLLRYFVAFVISQLYFVMITLGNLHGVIPNFYLSIDIYRIDLLIPLLLVQIPMWWLLVTVISIWKKSWWIEIGSAITIVAILWWILPYLAGDLIANVSYWNNVFQYRESVLLQHYITSTATMIIMVVCAFFIAILKNCNKNYK